MDKAMKILMTRHAIEQWQKRIDDDPPHDVTKLLDECIILQQRRVLYTPKGVMYKVLALYWHPERKIFFKVDKCHVVTILTAKDLKTNLLKTPACKSRNVE